MNKIKTINIEANSVQEALIELLANLNNKKDAELIKELKEYFTDLYNIDEYELNIILNKRKRSIKLNKLYKK